MAYRNILILGGAGFIGSHLTTYLAQHFDCQITVATRRYEHVAHLLALPSVGVFAGDIYNEGVLDVLVKDADVVINLVGTLYSRRARIGREYGVDFAAAHVQLTQKVIDACTKHGVKRYVHMSAFGTSDQTGSPFLQSKADGEDIAFSRTQINATVLRPSVVFGKGDRFLTLLAALQKNQWVIPVTDTQVQFQPLYVGDLVQAIVYTLLNDATIGQLCSIVGPQVYTLGDLFALTGTYAGHQKSLWEWPPNMAYWKRFFYPGDVLQRGELGVLQLASHQPLDPMAAQALAYEMQVTLTPLEDVAPSYLASGTDKI